VHGKKDFALTVIHNPSCSMVYPSILAYTQNTGKQRGTKRGVGRCNRGEGKDIRAIQFVSVIPTNPTLSDLVGTNDRRHLVFRAPPFGDIRSKCDTNTLEYRGHADQLVPVRESVEDEGKEIDLTDREKVNSWGNEKGQGPQCSIGRGK